VVDHRVAISRWHPEFAGNGVKRDTCRRQHRAYRDRLVKPVGRSMFADDIFTKTWTLIGANETGYAACNTSPHPPDPPPTPLPAGSPPPPPRPSAAPRGPAASPPCSAPRAAPPGMPCAWALSGKENSPATASIAPLFRIFRMVFLLLNGDSPS